MVRFGAKKEEFIPPFLFSPKKKRADDPLLKTIHFNLIKLFRRIAH